eukprot:TRINITY_DN6168_c0_g1_i1.p2 TRINITY_DN6168_c0_g1~~TRINITY_DN6168_c0_g1_i1.p2  ORF type:complete len:123 (+),score=23.28 TRINITY_DN6168_c0_g1_i1:97-465(+)
MMLMRTARMAGAARTASRVAMTSALRCQCRAAVTAVNEEATIVSFSHAMEGHAQAAPVQAPPAEAIKLRCSIVQGTQPKTKIAEFTLLGKLLGAVLAGFWWAPFVIAKVTLVQRDYQNVQWA